MGETWCSTYKTRGVLISTEQRKSTTLRSPSLSDFSLSGFTASSSAPLTCSLSLQFQWLVIEKAFLDTGLIQLRSCVELSFLNLCSRVMFYFMGCLYLEMPSKLQREPEMKAQGSASLSLRTVFGWKNWKTAWEKKPQHLQYYVLVLLSWHDGTEG